MLTKNADPDKYKYSSYGAAFDARSKILIYRWKRGKKLIIFRVDMSSSVHIDNKKNDINSL